MNILLVHNQYLRPGGEDSAVDAEHQLLADQGTGIGVLKFSNTVFTVGGTLGRTIDNSLQSIWSRTSSKKVIQLAGEMHPDLVHVHNFFPTASPSIYSAARSQGAAVVQTLHNYRLLCPNALFFRDGHVCEDCLGKFVPWPGVVHGCYRDSRAASGVTAAMLTVHRARRTWQNEVDMFIALTEFSRQKFIEGGLPADRIMVKPNFIDRPEPPIRRNDGSFLFVGRLVDYKGTHLLPQAWRQIDNPVPLRIVGDGPDREALEAASGGIDSITLLGAQPADVVAHEMQGAIALVLPSLLYENFPMTIVEAFASGLPVIASRLGAMAEIVEDGRTGLLFEPGDADDLAAKVGWASEHRLEMAQMGANARTAYQANYSAEENYSKLMEIYQQAIANRNQV